MAGESLDDLGVLVGGVVVDDGVHQLACGHLGLDGVEEADELLVAVTLHTAADDAAVDHVERGEQGGGAVPLVVVRHRAAAAALERQAGLGAVERLDLAFLVDRQHHRVGRRVEVEADDVAEFVGEARIVRQLELPHPVRLQAVAAPDALHRTDADAARLRHRRCRPVRRLGGRARERQSHDLLDHLTRQRRDARRPGLVAQQAVHAGLHEPLLPAPDGGLGHARLEHVSVVPWPPAVSSTIRARQTCFCEALRSPMMASSRSRSLAVTSIVIPVRIAPIRTPRRVGGTPFDSSVRFCPLVVCDRVPAARVGALLSRREACG